MTTYRPKLESKRTRYHSNIKTLPKRPTYFYMCHKLDYSLILIKL